MTATPHRVGRSTRTTHITVATLAVAALLGLTACTGSSGGSSSAAPPAKATTSATATTSTAASAAAPAAKNPYTGLGGVPKTPVIAVKIDDTAPGRPQVGIDKADVVYIEAVEAGYTRLAAVFGTNKPNVGYVRSTRPSDPDLLLQYGKITEAYSGGARVSLTIRKNSGLTGWSNDAGAAYYVRNNRSESDYINLTLNLAKVATKVKTAKPRSIGWTFNPSLAGLSTTTGTNLRTTVTGTYGVGTGTPVQFRWNPGLKKYVRYINGVAQHAADGKLVTATNVIVQSCEVHPYLADRDVNGYPAQFTTTIGSGAVSVFRQGKRVNGTWSRARKSAGTTLKAANGKPLPLNPGNTWVVLVRKGIPVRG